VLFGPAREGIGYGSTIKEPAGKVPPAKYCTVAPNRAVAPNFGTHQAAVGGQERGAMAAECRPMLRLCCEPHARMENASFQAA